MEITKVTVFGTGEFGARLAFHIAFNNIDVTLYDQDYGLLEEARTRFRELAGEYQRKFEASPEKIAAALANIAYSMDVTEAAGNAQLILEAVAEDLKAKKEFYEKLQKTAPEKAFFATTSEGFDPENLAKASGRPQKFLTLHFSKNFSQDNSLEIIALPAVRQEVLESVSEFSEKIGMAVTIRHLEQQD